MMNHTFIWSSGRSFHGDMKVPVVVRVRFGNYTRGYKICVTEVYNTYGALVQASGFPFQYALGQLPFKSIALGGAHLIKEL